MSRPILPANMRTLRIFDAQCCPPGNEVNLNQPHSPLYQPETVSYHFDTPIDVHIQDPDASNLIEEDENQNSKYQEIHLI